MPQPAVPQDAPSPPSLNEESRQVLSRLAWQALASSVSGNPLRELEIPLTGELAEPRGVFITLYRDGQLRGCIGNASPQQPLAEAVVEKTVAAASRDPRFPPLARDEVDHFLEVDISVLSGLVPLTGEPDEILESVRPGLHGLCLTLEGARGLLLPQVCSKFGWDAEEFLRQTSLKAELDAEAWRHPRSEILAFTTLTFQAERPRERRSPS